MTTTPPSIAALPAAPDPTNRATFNTLAYPWSAALPTFGTEVSAVATNVKANADEAAASAVSAAASVVSAAASVAAAQGAAAAAGAVVWVSGTTYAIGDARYSPANMQTYRRTTAGAGTTDPSADTTNWTRLVYSNPALVLLATLTPTAAANVDFLSTFSSTYDDYLVIGDGITVAADDIVKMRLAVAGAADSGSNYFVGGSYAGGNVTSGSTAIDASPTTTSAGKGCGFDIQITNANATTGLKMVRVNSVSQINATPGYTSRFTISAYTATNAISGLRLYCSGGSNFGATGQVRVYGIAKT